ncbi:DNA glycosylase [Amanita rubescens]|nr:DNA glycosylase [Amanita rubescens]
MSEDSDPLYLFYLRRLARWKPTLIQELANNSWRLLIAVILLNKTCGKAAIPVFWSIMKEWPTPYHLSQANEDSLKSVIGQLGLQSLRARRLIEISCLYLLDPPSVYDRRPSRHVMKGKRYPPTPISHLPGTGPYALDSYRIFCDSYDNPASEEWKNVMPTDKELIKFLKWKWAYIEHKEWRPGVGVIGPLRLPYLTSLVNEFSGNG